MGGRQVRGMSDCSLANDSHLLPLHFYDLSC